MAGDRNTIALYGNGIVKGVAIATAKVIHDHTTDVVQQSIGHEEVTAECERFDQARQQVASELRALIANLADQPTEVRSVLEMHCLLLDDPLLVDGVKDLIRHRLYNAQWALNAQQDFLCSQFSNLDDDYIRERMADIKQVSQRILLALQQASQGFDEQFMHNADHYIIVAQDISPADMVQLRQAKFAAFVTTLGGATSHTAIVARSMHIPTVVGVDHAHEVIQDNDCLIVDGEQGLILINPTSEMIASYQKKQLALQQERQQMLMNSSGLALTQDQKQIDLYANIETPQGVDLALDMGACGIGLFRTEFLFMGQTDQLPTEQEQYEAYAYVLQQMGPQRPVTIRTLDLGQDKNIHQFAAISPLGLRAIRYCLTHPEMFRPQLRALLRASVYGRLRVLIPMVSTVSEVHAIRQLIAELTLELQQEGLEHAPFELGIMVEVPAAALMIEQFMALVDFVSIGTNDLIQYTLASDRCDTEVAALYNPLHPAVIQLIHRVIVAGKQLSVPVSMCGEMAGDPQYTRLLLGLGLTQFSMHPNLIPDIRYHIQQSVQSHLQALVEPLVQQNQMVLLDQLAEHTS